MNKVYVCILSLCFCNFSFSQNNGSIYGSLVDTVLKQAVPDVTITILNGKDSALITFGRTNKKGSFDIKFLPKGSYRLLATHVGYRNYSRNFEISEDNKAFNAGIIIMNSKAALLEEVTVNQEKPPVTF